MVHNDHEPWINRTEDDYKEKLYFNQLRHHENLKKIGNKLHIEFIEGRKELKLAIEKGWWIKKPFKFSPKTREVLGLGKERKSEKILIKKFK